MSRTPQRQLFAVAILAGLFAAPIRPSIHAASTPPWVARGPEGRLVYGTDEQGNRIPDFSGCGYAGSDRPIPEVPARILVPAEPGDATDRIQRAIDYVAGLAPDAEGRRGAVLLLAGRHEVLGSLQIRRGGVVVRGQGMNAGGTTVVATGVDRRTLIRVHGAAAARDDQERARRIRDDYLPVGATRFQVEATAGLQPGDLVRIIRPSAQAWIDFLGANDLGGGVAGWQPGTRDILWRRTVAGVLGNEVTVDAPLTTALEQRFGGGSLERCRWPGQLTDVGIENLRLESVFDPVRPKDEDHAWCAITFENAADAWVRQVTFLHFAGSAVSVFESATRVTVQDCLSLAPVSEDGVSGATRSSRRASRRCSCVATPRKAGTTSGSGTAPPAPTPLSSVKRSKRSRTAVPSKAGQVASCMTTFALMATR